MEAPNAEGLRTTQRAALSVAEAAEYLGVNRRTLTRSLDEGEIPSIRVGRRRLIPTEGLRRLLSVTPTEGDAA